MITHATNTSPFDRLADVVRDVFGCADLTVTRETSSLDVDGWDSLTHTILLLRVESEFGVRLPLDGIRTIGNVGELADLVHSLSSGTTARQDDMPLVILHGNCQMGCMLGQVPPVIQAHGYQTVFIGNFLHPTMLQRPEPEQIARCGVFIEQVSPFEVEVPATYVTELPRGCRRLRVPALQMKSLWPFHQKDPRNVLTGTHPWGKHPYGDSYAMRLLRQSPDAEVVFRRYMETDINKVIDLDRFHEMAMAEAVAADQMADVPFAPILEQNFRSVRMFDTINHPSYALQVLLGQTLASFILEREVAGPPPLQVEWQAQMPVHPQVIEHFRLEWTTPDAKHLYFDRLMTFEQWLRAYIAFD